MEIHEMRAKFVAMSAKRDEYDKAKAVSSKAYAEYKTMESDILVAMETNELTKFDVDGLASFSRVDKLSYQTPKTREDKTKFFKFLKSQFGADSIDYMNVNSQTLNRLCKEWTAEGILTIEGLNEPISVSSLTRRKK